MVDSLSLVDVTSLVTSSLVDVPTTSIVVARFFTSEVSPPTRTVVVPRTDEVLRGSDNFLSEVEWSGVT